MPPRWGGVQEGKGSQQEGNEEKEMHINILMSFHKQMKMKAVHFQIDSTTALMYLLKRNSRYRLVCIPAVTSASKIFCLETRPIQSGYRCNATSLRKQIPLCIPTFLNYQQSFEQSKTGQGKQNAT